MLVYKVQQKEKKLPSVHVLRIPVKGRSNCRKKRTLWHHQWRHLPLRLTFWKKHIGDRETFKLMLFCLGNGCSPPLISRWILLSQTWAPDKVEKRARQLDYVLNNAEAKRGTWFYFDLDHNKLLYLHGLPKQQSQHQQDAAEKPRKSKKNHKRRKNTLHCRTQKKALLGATKTIKVSNQ